MLSFEKFSAFLMGATQSITRQNAVNAFFHGCMPRLKELFVKDEFIKKHYDTINEGSDNILDEEKNCYEVYKYVYILPNSCLEKRQFFSYCQIQKTGSSYFDYELKEEKRTFMPTEYWIKQKSIFSIESPIYTRPWSFYDGLTLEERKIKDNKYDQEIRHKINRKKEKKQQYIEKYLLKNNILDYLELKSLHFALLEEIHYYILQKCFLNKWVYKISDNKLLKHEQYKEHCRKYRMEEKY